MVVFGEGIGGGGKEGFRFKCNILLFYKENVLRIVCVNVIFK